MSTTLDLRGLTEAARLDKINEAVAVHVAKWTDIKSSQGCDGGPEFIVGKGFSYSPRAFEPVPPFATSADAVLPLLEKQWRYITQFGFGEPKRHSVMVLADREENEFRGTAPTFAEAACLALLPANGVEVLTK